MKSGEISIKKGILAEFPDDDIIIIVGGKDEVVSTRVWYYDKIAYWPGEYGDVLKLNVKNVIYTITMDALDDIPFARVSPAYGGKITINKNEEVNEGDFTLTIGSVKLMLKDKTKPEYQSMKFTSSQSSVSGNWGGKNHATNETIRKVSSEYSISTIDKKWFGDGFSLAGDRIFLTGYQRMEIDASQNLVVTFNEAIKCKSIDLNSFTLARNNDDADGEVVNSIREIQLSGNKMTIFPTDTPLYNKRLKFDYIVPTDISNQLLDLANNQLHAFESEISTLSPVPGIPTKKTGTTTTIELLLNENVKGNANGNSKLFFSFKTDGSANNINSFSLVDNKLTFLMEDELDEKTTEIVYTDPGEGVDGRLISLNNVPVSTFSVTLDLVSPAISTVTLDESGNVVLTFTKDLSGNTLDYNRFSLKKNSEVVDIDDGRIVGNTIILVPPVGKKLTVVSGIDIVYKEADEKIEDSFGNTFDNIDFFTGADIASVGISESVFIDNIALVNIEDISSVNTGNVDIPISYELRAGEEPSLSTVNNDNPRKKRKRRREYIKRIRRKIKISDKTFTGSLGALSFDKALLPFSINVDKYIRSKVKTFGKNINIAASQLNRTETFHSDIETNDTFTYIHYSDISYNFTQLDDKVIINPPLPSVTDENGNVLRNVTERVAGDIIYFDAIVNGKKRRTQIIFGSVIFNNIDVEKPSFVSGSMDKTYQIGKVVSGTKTSIGIQPDKTVYAWGSIVNSYNIPSLSNIENVFMNDDVAIFLKSDKTIVGHGNLESDILKNFASITDVSDVYLNTSAIAVLDTSKNVKIWGGDVTTVIDISNVEEIAVNDISFLLKKSDGTLVEINSITITTTIPTDVSNVKNIYPGGPSGFAVTLNDDTVEYWSTTNQSSYNNIKSQLVNRLVTAAWVLFITWRFYISESMEFDAFLIWLSFPFITYVFRYFLFGEKP